MNQLEIIHLRSAGEPLESRGNRIRESLGKESENVDVTLYRRDGLKTDVAVHLPRLVTSGSEGLSGLGLRLASSLRVFGLVEHKLWKELK